jgi:hypothetical protein
MAVLGEFRRGRICKGERAADDEPHNFHAERHICRKCNEQADGEEDEELGCISQL